MAGAAGATASAIAVANTGHLMSAEPTASRAEKRYGGAAGHLEIRLGQPILSVTSLFYPLKGYYPIAYIKLVARISANPKPRGRTGLRRSQVPAIS